MKLVKGVGSLAEGACWMSAIHYYTSFGKKDFKWTDKDDCVSLVIRELCIWLNDYLNDGEREAIIGPHLFAPLGTNTSQQDDEKRALLCADRACRVFAPMVPDADTSGLIERARAPFLTFREAMGIASEAVAWASEAAETVEGGREMIQREVLSLILDCCKIGTKMEVCPSKTKEEVYELLGR